MTTGVTGTAGPWTSLGYDWSHWSVCQKYALRDQTSWDFVLCEGNKGWPSAHTELPFLATLITGSPLFAFLMQGVFEIFEVTVLLVFNNFIVFDTLEAELETLAGSVFGDWLINGGLGVLAAYLLMDVFDFPGFLPPAHGPLEYIRNVEWAASGCPRDQISIDDRIGDFCVTTKAECALKSTPDCCEQPYAWTPHTWVRQQMQLVTTGTSHVCHALYWWIRVKTWFVWKLFMITGIAITLVHPKDCLEHQQPFCQNTGLVITTVLHVVLLTLVFFVFYRTCHDEYYVWRGYPWYKRVIVYFFAVLFVLLINAQGMRPWVPLFLGPAGAWTQVWLVSVIWITIFLILHLVRRYEAYAFTAGVYKRALFEVLRLLRLWWCTPYGVNCCPPRVLLASASQMQYLANRNALPASNRRVYEDSVLAKSYALARIRASAVSDI